MGFLKSLAAVGGWSPLAASVVVRKWCAKILCGSAASIANLKWKMEKSGRTMESLSLSQLSLSRLVSAYLVSDNTIHTSQTPFFVSAEQVYAFNKYLLDSFKRRSWNQYGLWSRHIDVFYFLG
jgi:hypothetical protein